MRDTDLNFMKKEFASGLANDFQKYCSGVKVERGYVRAVLSSGSGHGLLSWWGHMMILGRLSVLRKLLRRAAG